MERYDKICNLCSCTKFRTLESNGNCFKVFKCTNCSLIFVHPLPPSLKLKMHYNQSYYFKWIEEQKEKRIIMWNKRFNKIKKVYSEGRILDVGCGDGLFLEIAKKNGWHINGTELSPYASKYASENLGTNIFNGELPEAKFPDDTFDVVTMWHVLEHVRDPKSYFREVHRILKPDGLLILAVPNVNNLIMRVAYRVIRGRKMKIFSIDDKEIHLYHFSNKTLKGYFSATGFDCLRLSPDFGIVEYSKRLVNWISVIPYYIFRLNMFNSIEASAVARKY